MCREKYHSPTQYVGSTMVVEANDGPIHTRTTTRPPVPTPRHRLRRRIDQSGADRQGVNDTEFIMRTACEKAAQSLAERTRFVFDEKHWKAFMAALDRPAKDELRLRRLFREPHLTKRRS